MAKLSIDPDVIRELASLLDETNLNEIEWEEADQRVRVSRRRLGDDPLLLGRRVVLSWRNFVEERELTIMFLVDHQVSH